MTGLPCAFPLSRPPLSMRSKKDGAPRELAERRDWVDLDSPGGRVSQKTARGPVTASSPPPLICRPRPCDCLPPDLPATRAASGVPPPGAAWPWASRSLAGCQRWLPCSTQRQLPTQTRDLTAGSEPEARPASAALQDFLAAANTFPQTSG